LKTWTVTQENFALAQPTKHRSQFENMKLFQLPIALALLRTVTTHTVYTTLFTDGADQGDGTCIRMPMTQNNFTDPIKDLMSSDMACGMFSVLAQYFLVLPPLHIKS
jgi:hypothetical protein